MNMIEQLDYPATYAKRLTGDEKFENFLIFGIGVAIILVIGFPIVLVIGIWGWTTENFLYALLTDLTVISLIGSVIGKRIWEATTLETPLLRIAILTSLLSGKIRVVEPGLSKKWPWWVIEKPDEHIIDMGVQTTDDKKPREMSVFSRDGLEMKLKYGFFYTPHPKLILVYLSVDEDDSVIKRRLISAIEGIISRFTADKDGEEIRKSGVPLQQKVEEELKTMTWVAKDTNEVRVEKQIEMSAPGTSQIGKSIVMQNGITNIKFSLEDIDFSDAAAAVYAKELQATRIAQSATKFTGVSADKALEAALLAHGANTTKVINESVTPMSEGEAGAFINKFISIISQFGKGK